MNYKVFLSLGSNIEDREKYLLDAIDNISAVSGVSLEKISNIYETEPVGYTEQGRFFFGNREAFEERENNSLGTKDNRY